MFVIFFNLILLLFSPDQINSCPLISHLFSSQMYDHVYEYNVSSMNSYNYISFHIICTDISLSYPPPIYSLLITFFYTLIYLMYLFMLFQIPLTRTILLTFLTYPHLLSIHYFISYLFLYFILVLYSFFFI